MAQKANEMKLPDESFLQEPQCGTVLVGCKLPNGVVLEHPGDPLNKVILSGRNKSPIVGGSYGTTEVDAGFWAAWIDANKAFLPVKAGAIFEARTIDELKGKAADLKDEKSGFEALPQNAMGVKPATSND